MDRNDIRRIIKGIEEMLNAEIPGTPNIGGRVMYVALPGSGSKSKDVLSPRAQQVMAFLGRNRQASAKALQSALRVNRNVIAGAVHELKQARFIKSQPAQAMRFDAAEASPKVRRRKKVRG